MRFVSSPGFFNGSLKLTTSSPPTDDKLYNPDAMLPPRPTISNFQWISGTQYVSPADMDLLSKCSSFF